MSAWLTFSLALVAQIFASAWLKYSLTFTDGLTARFDAAKARYESLDETIRSKQSRRATIEDFLTTLKKANLVDTFDTALWCGLVDFATVYSKDDVRFTFKNGQEIKA